MPVGQRLIISLYTPVDMKTGSSLFWIGFLITIGIIITYIVMLIVDVTCFTTWIISLSLCGIVLVGSVMMLVGRSLERKSGYDI